MPPMQSAKRRSKPAGFALACSDVRRYPSAGAARETPELQPQEITPGGAELAPGPGIDQHVGSSGIHGEGLNDGAA